MATATTKSSSPTTSDRAANKTATKKKRAKKTRPAFDRSQDPGRLMAKSIGGHVVGLDEVGRGPLAGPVVAAAVVLDDTRPILGLADSKRLTEKAREHLVPIIHERALAVGVGVVEAERIDEINILEASLEAMAIAFAECEQELGEPILAAMVDGNREAPLPERVQQETLVKGDDRCEAIMAASIIAKVLRDTRMEFEDKRFPAYGFAKHKGYPTAAHREALMEVGVSPIHRRSFAPVRVAIEAAEDAASRLTS